MDCKIRLFLTGLLLIYEYGDRLKCQVVEYLRELFNKVLTENLHFNVGGFPPPPRGAVIDYRLLS